MSLRAVACVKRGFATQAFGGDAARYYMKFFNQAAPAWKSTVANVVNVNSSPSRIVDLASGPGEPACSLKARFPAAAVSATDVAEAMVAMSRKRAAELNLDVSCGVLDMNDMSSIDPGSVDVVTAQFGLMFTQDLPGALGQIKTVLRPKTGHLVGTVWNDISFMHDLKRVMTHVLGKEPPPAPVNPLSLSDSAYLDAALVNAGFTLEAGHNQTHLLQMTLGPVDDDETMMCALIPVLSSLAELQANSANPDGKDVVEKAMAEVRRVFREVGKVDDEGMVVFKDPLYRDVVARVHV